MSRISIQEVIEGCSNQQAKYQRIFAQRYADFLYAICLRYVGDREEAKDQLQKTLFKIFKNIHKLDPSKGVLESWISTIAINTCLSHLRKYKIRVIEIEEIPKVTHQVAPKAIQNMNTDEILRLVESLPDVYREIFNLIEIDGYNHLEVSEMLNIKEGSSRSRLSRAKELLRIKIRLNKEKESWVKTR